VALLDKTLGRPLKSSEREKEELTVASERRSKFKST